MTEIQLYGDKGENMKKLSAIIFLLAFVFTLSFTAFCENTKLLDNNNLLTKKEEEKIEKLLSQKTRQYGFDITILTEDYVEGAQSYADEFYEVNELGFGENRDGVLFLVTDDGVWFSVGGFGQKAVIPYTKELSEDFRIDSDEQGYAYAFEQFIKNVCEFVKFERECYENGITQEASSDKIFGYIPGVDASTNNMSTEENSGAEGNEQSDNTDTYSLTAKLAVVFFIVGAVVVIIVSEKRKRG